MAWKHRLTNINSAAASGDCANCGRVKVRFIKHKNSFRCREAIRAEQLKYDRKRNRHNTKAADSCEICGGTKRISYDHDHATGEFRGWLCHTCNVALGMAKDDPELLEKMAAYLRR